jgi:phosphate uptake regulator
MQRKLVKQGKGALTLSLPKKWLDSHNLEAGDEMNIDEETHSLTLSTTKKKATTKSINITLEEGSFNSFRSILGGLYRGGYDQIKVTYKTPKAITLLQKAVDSLYGFEIFDIDEKSCTIKGIYQEEVPEIESYVRKSIHTIKVMQDMIEEDLQKKKYDSKKEIFQLRNNVLKQRDLIIRIIVQNKLLEKETFPYYQISVNLWNIARNYYNLYDSLDKVSNKKIEYFKETNKMFTKFFYSINKDEPLDIHKQYRNLSNKGKELMKTKEASLFISYCLNILMSIQSSNSSVLLINL